MQTEFLLTLILGLTGCALAAKCFWAGRLRMQPGPAGARSRRAVLAAGAVLSLALLSCAVSDLVYDQLDPRGIMYNARFACHYEAEAELSRPLTAKHPAYDDEKATRVGDLITVVSWVDAEDNSGAVVRHPYKCVIHSSGGVDHLVSMDMK